MDQGRFQEAQHAYDAGDYRAAAKGFLAAAGKGPVGNGSAYHMAGNALMRLRRHHDALTVYGHALRDDAYERRGAVYANLGAAYVALGEYSEAVTAYERAIDEPGYETPYKAWQGIAAAHMERGKVEEAAIAYRRAALDDKNPDPGKALVNLGLCFMALGRPSDAAEAYKAALGFDSYQGRGKALSNLGQAYAAMGEYAEAVKAFEKATQLHAHVLSPAALAMYQTALEQLGPPRETVEGWETGEMPPVVDGGMDEPDGWATGELTALTGAAEPEPVGYVSAPPQIYAQPEAGDQASQAAAQLGFGDEAAVNEFFNLTEDEMKRRAREARRAERSARGRGGLVRAALPFALGALFIVGAVVTAYLFGLGWPTQESVVNGMFVAYTKGESLERYWVAVPDTDVKREMSKVPPVKSHSVGAVKRGRDSSTVRVKVAPEKGAELNYIVTLSREGVGWRVSGVDYNWRSTGN